MVKAKKWQGRAQMGAAFDVKRRAYMHEQFANAFYSSTAWKNARRAYWQKRGGLCERCLARGIVQPGDQVHHKTPLTPENIHDPRIALDERNLELLCRGCHEMQHGARRWRVDAAGAVEIR